MAVQAAHLPVGPAASDGFVQRAAADYTLAREEVERLDEPQRRLLPHTRAHAHTELTCMQLAAEHKAYMHTIDEAYHTCGSSHTRSVHQFSAVPCVEAGKCWRAQRRPL
eukprot:6182370-Pleurochrysis_carterae.AAC.2